MTNKSDDKIEKFNRQVAHVLWIIAVSMITSTVTEFLYAKSVGL